MATYGGIPTSAQQREPTTPTSIPTLISHAKARIRTQLATRRPWKEVAHLHAFTLPHGLSDCYLRARTNLAYFSTNYAIIALAVLFLSLLWHPISLIVFFIMMAVWLVGYFLRDEPLVLLGRTLSDWFVLLVLSVVTVVALLFTGATGNIVGALITAAAVVLVHSVLRKTEDLCLDEEANLGGGWYTVADTAGPPPPPPTSSSSK